MTTARRAACALMLSAALGSAHAAPLRICYEDVPQRPWTMPDGSGLNFQLLQSVAGQTNDRFEFLAMPWKRCLENLSRGEVDAAIGTTDAPERRAIGVFPTLPNGQGDASAALYEDNDNVFLRVHGAASWDGRKLAVPKGAVTVPRSYYLGDTLRRQGYTVDDGIKSAEEGLRRLSGGGSDVAVLLGHEAEALARAPEFASYVAEEPAPYDTVQFYMAASRAAYDRDPKRFEAIWAGIRRVRQSPDYQTQEKTALSSAMSDAGRNLP